MYKCTTTKTIYNIGTHNSFSRYALGLLEKKDDEQILCGQQNVF